MRPLPVRTISVVVVESERGSMKLVAILLYDTVLTFQREVSQIWSRGHISATGLYVAARYGAIVNHLAMVLILSTWRGQSLQVGPNISMPRIS